MMDNATGALAERLLQAFEQLDSAKLAACYADNCRVWHNHDRVYQTREENLTSFTQFANMTKTLSYKKRLLTMTQRGFAVEHELTAVSHGGAVLEQAGVIFCDVLDGKIVELREYLDSAQIAKWMAAANFH